jgi:hypothetical protein
MGQVSRGAHRRHGKPSCPLAKISVLRTASALTLALGCQPACTGVVGGTQSGGSDPSEAQANDPANEWTDLVGQIDSKLTGFTCADPEAAAVSHGQRLSSQQLRNLISDVFGEDALTQISAELRLLPEDSDSYKSGDLYSASSLNVEVYTNIALTLSEYVTSENARVTSVFGSCANLASPPASCLDNYLNGHARRLLRRNLTDQEKQDARTSVAANNSFKDGLRRLLAMHLLHPSFLLRLEVGNGNDASTQFQLSPFEVASRLAFATTNSGPDEALLDVAANGELGTVAQIKTQALRLMSTPRGRVHVREMFRQWLEQNRALDVSQLPDEIYQGVSPQQLISDAMAEQDRFIDHVVWERELGFEDLMTSRVSFASSVDLAGIYGHAPATDDQSRLMGDNRQGILLRVPFLASPKPRTSLVGRAVRLRRDVLCEDLPPPTMEAFAQRNQLEPTEAEREFMSTATYIERLTDSPACLACHSKINPTGIAFESYDSIGRFRSEELLFNTTGAMLRSVDLAAPGPIPLWNGETSDADDAVALVTSIAARPEARACFVRQSFRFFSKRFEDEADGCLLTGAYSELDKERGTVLGAFVSVVANPASFVRRKE